MSEMDRPDAFGNPGIPRQNPMSSTDAAELARLRSETAALREQLTPAKINVASLGNMVPHVHWHVIARFAWDSHFPAPVWAAAQRKTDEQQCAAVSALLPPTQVLMARKLALLDA